MVCRKGGDAGEEGFGVAPAGEDKGKVLPAAAEGRGGLPVGPAIGTEMAAGGNQRGRQAAAQLRAADGGELNRSPEWIGDDEEVIHGQASRYGF